MKNLVLSITVTILLQAVPSCCDVLQCTGTQGATYVDCNDLSGSFPVFDLQCCGVYAYSGGMVQRYKIPNGNIHITITALTLAAGETINIKNLNCDGCKQLVINSTVVLPLEISIQNPRFTISSTDKDAYLLFNVGGPDCDCSEPCMTHTVSGVYNAVIGEASYEVFCEYTSEGQGCVYISTDSVTEHSNDIPLNMFHNDDTRMCIKFKRGGGQKISIIEQLSEYSSYPLSFQNSAHNGYQLQSHDNVVNEPYIFVGLIPKTLISKHVTQGYNHNGNRYTFTNCDHNPNSYFAFVVRSLTGDQLQGNRPWINSASNSAVNLPDRFFYYVESHHGGCGVYYHKSWASIGLAFNY